MEYEKLIPVKNYIEHPFRVNDFGILQFQATEIRKMTINWEIHKETHFINSENCEFIKQYCKVTILERDKIIKENPQNCARVFVHLLNKISSEKTIQYLLTIIDDLLQEDKARVDMFSDYFHKVEDSMMDNFLCFLHVENKFIAYQASRIVVKLACWSSKLMERKDLQYFLQWISDELLIEDNEYIETLARNLQMLLRIRQYRIVFVNNDGIESIIRKITCAISSQTQYQLIFCLWCLSFDPDIVQRMVKTPNLITAVSDIIRQTEREKVVRISIAYFRNLIEKLDSRSKVRDVALAMVHCRVLKHLEMLQQKDFSHDPELTDDLAYLLEKLTSNIQDVSSLEEYTTELRSGRLEWSPVHKSEKFWRENTEKFIDKNYEMLKMLVRLLETSKEPLTLQVALHDVGEFVRYYARGKQVIEKLGGKDIVMQFLNDPNISTRYQALMAVQKIMVVNWQYLSNQVDVEIDLAPESSAP